MTVRRRALAMCLTAASCGRFGFDARRDASADAGPTTDAPDAPETTAVVVGSAAEEGSGTELTVAAALPSSDVLVVAITTWDPENEVASVTDSTGHALTPAGVRATAASVASELWYASPSAASEGITVTMTGASAGFDVWVAAFSGVAVGAPAAIGSGCLQYPPDLVAAPVTTTSPGELVIATTMFAAPVYIDGVASPFTALGPYLTGNGAAYEVAPEPGSYAPSWTIASGSGMSAMTCASTAAFRAAP